MQTLSTRLLLTLLAMLVYTEVMATTISGNISYAGSSTDEIAVAVFTDIHLSGDPAKYIQIDVPGSYSITELPDGVYYVISIMGISQEGEIEPTDPWGVYGTLENLTPVTITGGVGVSGIDITLVDGTAENPNPFGNYYISPTQTIQLPEITEAGVSPAIFSDGTSIYLYKQDYSGSGNAKIFVIAPSGEITSTIYLALESSPNRICWIETLTFHNGDIWVKGGYGDPLGYGGIPGIFKIDVSSSTSSNQMPESLENTLEGGLASDGLNIYAGINMTGIRGIIKFNPDQVSALPSSLFIELDNSPRRLCFGDGFLWAGIDNRLKKINPENGTVLASYNIPPLAAELYFNDMFWNYSENDNTLEAYSIDETAVENEKDQLHSTFYLSQNYPNPFNPTTTLSYSVPKEQLVTLKVYSIIGEEIATLVNEIKQPGIYNVTFKGTNLSSGVYLYSIKAGEFTQVKKMIINK